MVKQLSLFDDERRVIVLPQGSLVIVSISGGKDSIAPLLIVLELFGPGRVIAHHQVVLEDWPKTIPYCQQVCDRCLKQEIAFFHKQWGGRTPKAGGRELDGQTWDQMPWAYAIWKGFAS